MTFIDITRTMLTSMDFFELRRTASRYEVPFQGVRRQKLIKDIEKQIMLKAEAKQGKKKKVVTGSAGAVSARPKIERKISPITTFSPRNSQNNQVGRTSTK